MVAMDVSATDHVTVLSLAVDGRMFATSFRVLSFCTWQSPFSISTDQTDVDEGVTTISTVSVWPPSSDVTVISASPAETAVTLPLESTVATDSSDELHVTFLFLAPVGSMVTFSAAVFPTSREEGMPEILTDHTLSVAAVTATWTVSVYPPSTDVAVTVTDPDLRALNVPSLLIDATEESLTLHVTSFCVALDGETSALNWYVVPVGMDGL